jgi:hypothetical protein
MHKRVWLAERLEQRCQKFVADRLDDIRDAAALGGVFSLRHAFFPGDPMMVKLSNSGMSAFDGLFPADAEHLAVSNEAVLEGRAPPLEVDLSRVDGVSICDRGQ